MKKFTSERYSVAWVEQRVIENEYIVSKILFLLFAGFSDDILQFEIGWFAVLCTD